MYLDWLGNFLFETKLNMSYALSVSLPDNIYRMKKKKEKRKNQFDKS